MVKPRPAHIREIRRWRSEGLSYPAIRARCIEKGHTTQLGTVPSLNTLHKWCKGVIKPLKPKPPKLPPRPRYDGPRTFPPSLIISLARDVAFERNKAKTVKAWRAEGLTFEQLRQRCEAHGIKTQYGKTPSAPTIHRWVNEPDLSTRAILQRILGRLWADYIDELAERVSKVVFKGPPTPMF